jgi:hypothetical protein
LQKRHERFDVVCIEHAADRQGTQRCVIDLDGDGAIAVELVRHFGESSAFKSYLALLPGHGLLHIDGDRVSRYTVSVNADLVSSVDPHCTRRQSAQSGLRRLPGAHGDASLNDRHDGRIGSAVNIDLSSQSEYVRIASRDAKTPLVVSRYHKECLTSRNLDHPLAARIPNRHRRIRVEMEL